MWIGILIAEMVFKVRRLDQISNVVNVAGKEKQCNI